MSAPDRDHQEGDADATGEPGAELIEAGGDEVECDEIETLPPKVPPIDVWSMWSIVCV